jgi:hypothetical protein
VVGNKRPRDDGGEPDPNPPPAGQSGRHRELQLMQELAEKKAKDKEAFSLQKIAANGAIMKEIVSALIPTAIRQDDPADQLSSLMKTAVREKFDQYSLEDFFGVALNPLLADLLNKDFFTVDTFISMFEESSGFDAFTTALKTSNLPMPIQVLVKKKFRSAVNNVETLPQVPP